MALTYTPGATPREELNAVIVQGRGINDAEKLIGRKILPDFGVNRQNAHLVKLTIAQGDLLRIMDKIVAPGGDISETTMTFGDDTISVPVRKEQIFVPHETELTYGSLFSAEALAANIASDKLDLLNEYLIEAAIFNTGTFGAATNSAVAYIVANLGTISFISDIYASITRVRDKGEEPNTIVIPELVYQRIRQSSLVVAFVRGQLAAQVEVNTNTIQKAFADEGIEQVLVGRARYNNAAPGATPIITKVWPPTYIWVGRCGRQFSSKDNGIETVEGVGANIYWDEYGRHIIESYPWLLKEGIYVRGKTAEIPYIANANAGDLIATQFA